MGGVGASGRGGEGLSRRIWAAVLPPASARRGAGTGSISAQPTGVGARCRPQRGAALAYKACPEGSMCGLAVHRRVRRDPEPPAARGRLSQIMQMTGP